MAEPMDAARLANVTQYLIAARRSEAIRFAEIYAYFKNLIIDVYIPKKASDEYRKLVDQSRFNILTLLVQSLANNFFIDGYRPARSAKNADVWDAVWQPNRMDARQSGLWRSALQYGVSYATVLPGELNGKQTAKITPWSPRRLTALYEDPINDEWAQYFMTVGTARPKFGADGTQVVTPVAVYDATHRYEIDVPTQMISTQIYTPNGYNRQFYGEIQVNTTDARVEEHGMGVAPVVRFMDTFGDLDDGPEGVVWPMLPAQRQLNQTTFGLGMAELYAAFKQRWVTGLPIQEDDDGNAVEPFQIAVDRLLHAEDVDVKFGEFSETNLEGYLKSRDKTLLHISAVRQFLPHTLVVGDSVSNISAEALAALDVGHKQDIAEHKASFGESGEQLMRLSGKASKDTEAWEDTSAQVRWRDTTPRSLAQVADALGKLALQLGIPPRALWERIPDVTDQDLEQWERLAKEDDSFAKLKGLMDDAQPGGRQAAAAPPPAGGGDRQGGGGRGPEAGPPRADG